MAVKTQSIGNNTHNEIWPRRIVCVDMNAFFASCEQQAQKHLRGKPVAITNGKQGSCIITSSYEARAFGVVTGMRFSHASSLCPNLIQCASRPELYASISTALMRVLQETISPDIEVFSVDEAFLDVSSVLSVSQCPYELCFTIKNTIKKYFGLPCSVGVSINKALAKYAAKSKKPMGVVVIPPSQVAKILKNLPVSELCGIGQKVTRYLASFGAHTCAQVSSLPVSVLSRRFGCLGQRLWLMCSGKDPDPIRQHVSDAKSMGHGKRLPPGTQGYQALQFYLHHMAYKLTERLYTHRLFAQKYCISVLSRQYGWFVEEITPQVPCRDYTVLVRAIDKALIGWKHLEGCIQVQVTAVQITSFTMRDLLNEQCGQHEYAALKERLYAVQTDIKKRYGRNAIVPARLLERIKSPDVIAPSWKPYGVRKTVG